MKSRRVRYKVALRPRQRTRRNRVILSVFAVAVMGAAAAATLRQMARQVGNPFVYLRNTYSPSTLMSVTVSAPSDALRDSAVSYLSTLGKISPSAQAQALKDHLSWIKSVDVSREWLRRRAVLTVTPRVAIAAAQLKGRSAGWLSDEGVVFDAPEGAVAVDSPRVDATGAGAHDLKAAAALLREAAREGALPSPLVALRLVSSADGWQAQLQDGTVVLWGDGRWLSDKLARLREVLADARELASAKSGGYTADLRYFEDGKVLLRPLPARSVSMR